MSLPRKVQASILLHGELFFSLLNMAKVENSLLHLVRNGDFITMPIWTKSGPDPSRSLRKIRRLGRLVIPEMLLLHLLIYIMVSVL